MVMQSLPQLAYTGTTVLAKEAEVAHSKGIVLYELMKRAGQAVFNYIDSVYPNHSMLVLCGKGNNGGDGFVVARLALQHSITVKVVLFARIAQLKGDARQACDEYLAIGGEVEEVDQDVLVPDNAKYETYQLVVDAVFGIGFKGQLPSLVANFFSMIQARQLPVVSIDVPSGVNATTGEISSHAIIAKATVSFIAMKQGLLTGGACHHVGELIFESLSLAHRFCQLVKTTTQRQTTENLPTLLPRVIHQHKGHIGLLLSIGGQSGMPGAIRLASEAALRCGAPLVSVLSAEQNHSIIMNNRYELMLAGSNVADLQANIALKKAKAAVIGPGLGQSEWAQSLLDFMLCSDLDLVIDADALSLLASNQTLVQGHTGARVLTPHPKEAAILLGCSVAAIENNRFDAVKKIANTYQCVCLLKGPGTLVSDGEQVFINTTGNHAMATGGMGDVLAGMIGALILQTDNLLDATRLAVYLHGKAGDNIAAEQGYVGLLASDLFSVFPTLLQSVYEPVSS